MNTKTIVIYHKSDFDGIFCREIAKKFLGEDNVEYIGWEYGEKIPEIAVDTALLMLDISIDGLMNHPNLFWIDHHKTAIEKFGKKKGFQIDGVAACRLTWQWFFILNAKEPSKQEFIERTVKEPWAVRLAGEYDIWDKRDPDAELFQHGLRSEELDWFRILSFTEEDYIKRLLNQGRAIQFAKTKENESIITNQGFVMIWENLRWLVCNHARFNSFLFDARITKDFDGCLGFCYDGSKWKISMYHTPFNKEIDLSEIAKKYGGGGHKGACGFTCKELPFKL